MNSLSNQPNNNLTSLHTSKMRMDQPKQALTPMENGLVGALAGLVEVSVDQPLVTLKNELQRNSLNSGQKGNPLKFVGSLSPRTLWSGWSANATGMAGVTGVQVAVKGAFEKHLSNNGERTLSSKEKLLSAVASGVVAASVACPSELVMMRHQERVKAYLEAGKCGVNANVASAPTYASTMKDLHAKYGVAGFGRGMVATAVRDGGFTAAYGYGAKYLADKFKPFFQDDRMCGLAGGVTAGLMAAVVTHPFDTWKTKRQSGLKTEFYPGGLKECATKAFRDGMKNSGLYGGCSAVFREVFREPYRGFTPRATRVVMAVTMLTTLVHEMEQALQNSK